MSTNLLKSIWVELMSKPRPSRLPSDPPVIAWGKSTLLVVAVWKDMNYYAYSETKQTILRNEDQLLRDTNQTYFHSSTFLHDSLLSPAIHISFLVTDISFPLFLYLQSYNTAFKSPPTPFLSFLHNFLPAQHTLFPPNTSTLTNCTFLPNLTHLFPSPTSLSCRPIALFLSLRPTTPSPSPSLTSANTSLSTYRACASGMLSPP